jgi:hypothetical protein
MREARQTADIFGFTSPSDFGNRGSVAAVLLGFMGLSRRVSYEMRDLVQEKIIWQSQKKKF